MKKITDSIYQIGFFGGYMNVYIIERGDDLTLVDVGVGKATVDGIQKALEKEGRSLDQIKHILITHAHPDHIGGLADIQKVTNARTLVHHRDAAVTRGEAAYVMPDPKTLSGMGKLTSYIFPKNMRVKEPSRVDVELKEGDVLDDVLPGMRVIELPGHSNGQVGYYWPARKLLIGGDVLFNMWGLRMPFTAVSPDWEEAKRSIKKVATMDVEILCLGHGPVIIGGAQAKVKTFAARL